MSHWLDLLRTFWRNLSGRERSLVSIVGVGGSALAVFFLGVSPILAAYHQSQEDVLGAESQLAAMVRLRHEYDTAHARLAALETRIQTNKDHRNVLTLLESLASKEGVTVESMKERRAGTNESYREQRVEVVLKNVTLEQAVKYLHGIESAKRPFSVKSLRLKNRSDDSKLLDVTFSVSSFEPI
ncbi:MAG: type II secretion system protein GspM [Myxococcota bacterium]|mgnify:FL=1